MAHKIPMQEMTKVLRHEPYGPGSRPGIVAVSRQTATVLHAARARQLGANAISTAFMEDPSLILSELIQHDLCSEVFTEEILPSIVWALLHQLPTDSLAKLSLTQVGDSATRIDKLALGIANSLKLHQKPSLDHLLTVIERVHDTVFRHAWYEARAILEEGKANPSVTPEDVKNLEHHCAYTLGMVSRIVPLAAEYIVAINHIKDARKHFFIKSIVSGTLKIGVRVAAAILTAGVSEAGIGRAITKLGDPGFGAIGSVVANMSANQEKRDITVIQQSRSELKMVVNAARIQQVSYWAVLGEYYAGAEWMWERGNDRPEVAISKFRQQSDWTKKAMEPSPLPAFVGLLGKSMAQATSRITANMSGNAVKQMKSAKNSQKKDRQFVLPLVEKDGQALKHADESLRNDVDMMEVALWTENKLCKQLKPLKQLARYMKYPDLPFLPPYSLLEDDYPRVLRWIGLDVRVFGALLRCRDDKQFFMDALRANDEVAFVATPELWADRDFALLAVELAWTNYQFVNENLKNDQTFSRDCCKLHAEVIGGMFPDRPFALQALEVNPKVINMLPDEYLEDTDFLIDAFGVQPSVWSAVDETTFGAFYFELMFAINKFTNGEAFRGIPEEERDDELYAAPALRADSLLLEYAGPTIRNNFNIALEAVVANPSAMEFVGDELKANPGFIAKVRERSYAAASEEEAQADDTADEAGENEHDRENGGDRIDDCQAMESTVI